MSRLAGKRSTGARVKLLETFLPTKYECWSDIYFLATI